MIRRFVSIPSACLMAFAAACGTDDGGSDAENTPLVSAPTDTNTVGAGTGPSTPVTGTPTGPGLQQTTPQATVDGPTGSLGPTASGPGPDSTDPTQTPTSSTDGPSGSGGPGAIPTGPSGPVGAGGAPVGPEGVGGTPMGPEPEPEPTLVTSSPGSYWNVGEVTEMPGGNASVTVTDKRRQRWDGFGGTFNEVGWDQLSKLPVEKQEEAMRLLFSSRDGAGFTYGRIPIGSSDYGVSRYTLDDVQGTDYEMEQFSIERDKMLLIPYIKAALKVKPDIRFWASPWTPPPWMKDNGAYDRGNMKSDDMTLAAHALYLSKFVEAYEEQGIRIEALHPQNEPGYPQDYPSCAWSASTFTKYIGRFLGPTLEERGLDTEIWIGTMSNSSSASIVSSVMGDGNASKYIKGIGLQWTMDGSASQYANNYDFPIMQTEHRCGNYPWESGTFKSGGAPNDHAYANESWGLIKGWLEKGVNSYLAWNMVLDTKGFNLDEVRPWPQNALLTVDTGSQSLNITPTYYVFRHLAQYVEPGAYRVDVSGNADAVAFENPDGSIVAIFHGGGGDSQMTLGIGGTTVQFTVPGNGWATVNWPAGG